MRRRFCGVQAANYLLSQYRHIETEEFKRRVAVDPAIAMGLPPLDLLLAPMGWRYYFFGACMSKPRNSNGVSPLTQPCHVCGWNRMTSSGL
jgi:hypothetical protein